MIQFYSPDIAETLTLPQSDSQHCIRVLRMHVGDPVQVVDGHGYVYSCRLLDEHPKHTTVTIDHIKHCPRVWPVDVTVMVAPTKHNDRMEWLVEKLVEVGVDRIVPVKCRYSERKELNRERMEKIAVAAMKQSLKAVLPHIAPMMPLRQAVETYGATQKFVGYCDADTPRTLLSRACRPGTDTIILIGPEGDFSAEEITFLQQNGYIPVTMGDNRLRTETAALVGCDTVHIINQLAND